MRSSLRASALLILLSFGQLALARPRVGCDAHGSRPHVVMQSEDPVQQGEHMPMPDNNPMPNGMPSDCGAAVANRPCDATCMTHCLLLGGCASPAFDGPPPDQLASFPATSQTPSSAMEFWLRRATPPDPPPPRV